MAGEVCSTTLHSWRGESPLVALYGSSLFLWCCRAEFGKCDDSGAAKACVILVEAALALPVNGLSMCIQFLEGMIEVETPNSACLYYSVLGFLICVSRFASVDPGFHLNEPSAQKLDRAIEHIIANEIHVLETSYLDADLKRRLFLHTQACQGAIPCSDLERLALPLTHS
jgi:hypothetical protein